jgi:hypothetical protein
MKLKNTAKLSGEDAARMQRLHEEVFARLQEMALISTRVMVQTNPDFAKVVKRGTKQPEVQFNVKTSRVCYGSGKGMCLCMNYDTQTCSVCDGPTN